MMQRLVLQTLVVLAIIVGFAATGSTGETKKIYDKNWNLKGYVRDDGSGTKKIYDKNWNTRGYIKGDRVYDKDWNHTGTIRDSDR